MAEEHEQGTAERASIPETLPVLPLRGIVVLPLAVVPIAVNMERSVKLVDDVMRRNRLLALVLKRPDAPDEARPEHLRAVGTAGVIHQLSRAPDGSLRLVVQGLQRVRFLDFVGTEPYLVARIQPAPDQMERSTEGDALRRVSLELFQRLVGIAGEIPDEVSTAAGLMQDPRQLAYLIAAVTPMEPAVQQEILSLIHI